MKTLTQTIIVIVAISLFAACVVSANNVSEDEFQAVELQIQQAELEQQSRAEVAASLAQVQLSMSAAPEAPVLPSTPSPVPGPPPPTLPAVNNNIYNLSRSLSLGSRSAGGDMVLVIPSRQTSTEEIITINEDMSVMSRIFEKNFEQARISTARGSVFVSRHDPLSMFIGGSRSQIQSIYLQGYGALFLMKVDFPLSPPSNAQEQKDTNKEQEGDPVWQQMKQEMYEPQNVDRRHRPDQPEQKYDAEKVENLKTTLIDALKHAANIRSLKPDESLILTITGSSETAGTIITSARSLPGENQVIVQEKKVDGKMVTRIVRESELDEIGSASPAILVIRAKKSQIDAFAKGEVDFDRFRESVQVLTYPLLSGAIGSSGSNMFIY